MQKRWVQNSQSDKEKAIHLASQLNIDVALTEILVNRSIDTFDKAKNFFRPQLAHLHDPFLMKDMREAILRIEKALNTGEKILVYGDYDVDGTTAVSIVYDFFKDKAQEIEYYIPDRHLEGYGISTQGIDYAHAHHFTLIIALDCGIKSIDKVEYASSLGIDFIICDHHLPGTEIPKAYAVLDPKRKDCSYPFKELSGCGVGFKLIQAYCIQFNLPDADYLKRIDLVMVSIAADMVSMQGENRILAWYGLEKLNSQPSKGLKALMQLSAIKEKYTITDVVFQLAPKINAAGRINHAKEAVKMLLSDENAAALEQSNLINTQNTERKSFDQNITIEALEILESDIKLKERKTTVVFKRDWNKGVIGIVASRLTEKYYRPTIVLTHSNGLLTGSARSVAGYDLYEALLSCTEYLEQFGGHQFAAGLTLKEENLQPFSNQFEQVVAATITDDLLIPQITVDSALHLNQINGKFYRILEQMAPFGPDNMTPVFVTKNVKLTGTVWPIGQDHLKFSIMQDNSPIFDCIAFGLANHAPQLKMDTYFKICYTIEENNWKNKKNIQLNIKGIALIK